MTYIKYTTTDLDDLHDDINCMIYMAIRLTHVDHVASSCYHIPYIARLQNQFIILL